MGGGGEAEAKYLVQHLYCALSVRDEVYLGEKER